MLGRGRGLKASFPAIGTTNSSYVKYLGSVHCNPLDKGEVRNSFPPHQHLSSADYVSDLSGEDQIFKWSLFLDFNPYFLSE